MFGFLGHRHSFTYLLYANLGIMCDICENALAKLVAKSKFMSIFEHKKS